MINILKSKETVPSPTPQKIRIGLALSGGGAKGLAHVGALKALEEFGLKPDIISGVSAGAIIGAFYADGHTPDEICQFFKETEFFDYVKVTRRGMGLLSTNRFEKMLTKALRSKTFEELNIPLVINATELTQGKNEFFSSGPLVEKVIASASVPIFLKPKTIGDKIYVDGGIFNNMPSNIIRDKCDYLIGCHVNPIVPMEIDGVFDILERIYNLSIQSSTVPEKSICDLVLEPVEARNFGIFNISQTEEIFNIGYKYTKERLEKMTTDGILII